MCVVCVGWLVWFGFCVRLLSCWFALLCVVSFALFVWFRLFCLFCFGVIECVILFLFTCFVFVWSCDVCAVV